MRARYELEHPDWGLVEAHAPAGAWVKAAAVTPAVEQTNADIVVIADADVWTDGLHDAIARVATGAPWAIPHRAVFRLSQHATHRVLDGDPPAGLPLEQRAYLGTAGGGIVVLPRTTYLQVPLDPRFVGWGQEDEAWGVALHHLAGPAWRGKRPLFHLWHPPQDRMTRRHGNRQSVALWRRYLAARGKPDLMRSLLSEIEVISCPSLKT